MTKKAVFYIDGFNLYHALKNLSDPHLRWLDLRAVASRLYLSRDEHIEKLVYFSAYPTHFAHTKPHRLSRHLLYVDALQATGVECRMGRFKTNTMKCRSCNHQWPKSEEKETDVAIGVRLSFDACLDNFDVAYILSGDTDLVPAIKAIKEHFPEKEIVTVQMRKHHPAELLNLTDRRIRLRRKLIEQCLLPQTIPVPDQSKSIVRPVRYDPPKTS